MIGENCGQLLEVDSRSRYRLIISAIRMKVEVESIVEIPRTLCYRNGEISALLVVEVESPVCMFQGEVVVGDRGFILNPNCEVRDNSMGKREPLVIPNLDHPSKGKSFGVRDVSQVNRTMGINHVKNDISNSNKESLEIQISNFKKRVL